MNTINALRFALPLAIGALTAHAQDPTITPEMLQAWLKQYPAADANKDGVLTEAEARAYYAHMQAAGAAAHATPAPTRADLSYGPHRRNVLDLWQAKDDQATPLVIYIHGGGFVSGDKSSVRAMRLVRQCLDNGVSIASINYRYLSHDVPLQDVLHDAARAVQYLRAHATELKIDPTRIAACGNSAGAGTSLWLAFHPDMADPHSADPLRRESTRLTCAVSWDGQFSYDLPLWAKYFGADNRARYGGIYNSPAIYGLDTEEQVDSPAGRKRRAECNFYDMISADDPPVYIGCSLPGTEIDSVNEYLHNPKHSLLLLERCRAAGVTAVAKINAFKIAPAAGEPPYGEDFMFKYLKAPRG